MIYFCNPSAFVWCEKVEPAEYKFIRIVRIFKQKTTRTTKYEGVSCFGNVNCLLSVQIFRFWKKAPVFNSSPGELIRSAKRAMKKAKMNVRKRLRNEDYYSHKMQGKHAFYGSPRSGEAVCTLI